MNKLIVSLIVSILVCTAGFARVQPEVTSKFRSNLYALIRASKKPSGFDSLKQNELGRGLWNCRLELEGFLPVVEENEYHPASRLEVSAVSVTPAAMKNVRMLVLKGIPGYTMRDSDADKTVPVDRTRESRRVVFTRKDANVESTVTVIYNAHQYASVQLMIEAW